jgi:hypothetical protein
MQSILQGDVQVHASPHHVSAAVEALHTFLHAGIRARNMPALWSNFLAESLP